MFDEQNETLGKTGTVRRESRRDWFPGNYLQYDTSTRKGGRLVSRPRGPGGRRSANHRTREGRPSGGRARGGGGGVLGAKKGGGKHRINKIHCKNDASLAYCWDWRDKDLFAHLVQKIGEGRNKVAANKKINLKGHVRQAVLREQREKRKKSLGFFDCFFLEKKQRT